MSLRHDHLPPLRSRVAGDGHAHGQRAAVSHGGAENQTEPNSGPTPSVPRVPPSMEDHRGSCSPGLPHLGEGGTHQEIEESKVKTRTPGTQSCPCPVTSRRRGKDIACGANSSVIRTRRLLGMVIRARRCAKGHRFQTEEKPQ